MGIRLTGQTVVSSPENPIPLTPADWTGNEAPLPLTWDAMILKVVALFTEVKLALRHRHRHKYPHLVVELARLATRLLKVSPLRAQDLIPNPDIDLTTDPIHVASQQLIDSISRLAVDIMESAGSWSLPIANDFCDVSVNYAISCSKNYIGHLQTATKIINDPNQSNLLHPNVIKSSELGPLTDFKLTLRIEILTERIGQSWSTLQKLLITHTYKFPNVASIPPRCPTNAFHKKIDEISVGFLPSLQAYLGSIGNLISLLSWLQMKEDLSNEFLRSENFPHPILANLIIVQRELLEWMENIINNLVITVNMAVTGMFPLDLSFWKRGYDLTRELHKVYVQLSQSQPTLGYLTTSSLLSHSPKQIGSRQVMSIMKKPNVNLEKEWKRASHIMLKKMTSPECPILLLKSRLLSLFKTRGITQDSGLGDIKFPVKPIDLQSLSDTTNETDYDSSIPSSPEDAVFDRAVNSDKFVAKPDSTPEPKKTHTKSKSKVTQVQYHSSSGKLRLATWNALIEMLTPNNKASDSKFMRVFFLSFRYFATPEELFYALREQFEGNEFDGKPTPKDIRVYNALKCWIEMYYFQEDYAIIPLVREFAASYLSKILPSGADRLSQVAQEILNFESTGSSNTLAMNAKYKCISRSNENKAHNDSYNNSILSTTSPLGNATLTPDHPIIDWVPLQLAQVLTAIDSELFNAIQPQHLMRPTESGHASSVKKMSDWNNQVTTWVIETILAEHDIRKRGNILKSYVRVAEKLYSLNNFNSLMAVLSGLNSSAISRLNETWCVVSTQFRTIFDHLNQTFDPKKNFLIYRNKLKDTPPPCIPFFGIYLTDLTFIHQGNPTYKTVPLMSPDKRHDLDITQIETPPPNPPHHHSPKVTYPILNQKPEELPTGPSIEYINFDKFSRLVKVVDEIENFQVPYNLHTEDIDELCDVLKTQIKSFDPLNTHAKPKLPNKNHAYVDHSKDHYHRSLMLEPREKNLHNVSSLSTTIEIDESNLIPESV
jgi:hypothetical protein